MSRGDESPFPSGSSRRREDAAAFRGPARGRKGEADQPQSTAPRSAPRSLSMLLLTALLCGCVAAALDPVSASRPEPSTHAYRQKSYSRLGTSVLITGNSTLTSPNQTFEIGFFTGDGGSRWYFGIWYASIPVRTYVWVANRDAPVGGDLTPATVRLTAEGLMTVRDNAGRDVWATDNAEPAAGARILDTGNLVLLAADGSGRVVWQSFDLPADTWLPDMSVSARRAITSWRSPVDPSPGPYSLQLKQPDYGEFHLVYENRTLPPITYWSTGKWTGNQFTGVPEMTVPYIYNFRFDRPFTPDASFVYSEAPSAFVPHRPFLTRFVVEPSGQLRQYTWSSQTSNWNMFWYRPENPCHVYALCGDMGFCREGGLHHCDCLAGFGPSDPAAWNSDDYLGGCSLETGRLCDGGTAGDAFDEVGAVEFDGASTVSFSSSSQDSCEQSCLKNCSCRGLNFNPVTRLCRNLYGNLLNLRNSTVAPVLYVRVSVGGSSSSQAKKKNGGGQWKTVAVSAGSVGVFLAMSAAAILAWTLWGRGKRKRKRERGTGIGGEDGDVLVMVNLRVFSYKELSTATRGFSEVLGHGGFGAVFRGELPDSSLVAVKRLERPGGGDREFRAEVRTIGSIQHVNLVRLRGFCSEDAHRLLVYEYMPRGPLSAYLGRDGQHRRRHHHLQPLQDQQQQQQLFLSWEDRLRVAIGTARGIAYLHEECRDCIVHCDIKPENILLDSDYTPKVSDFGLAKLIGRDFSRVLTTMRGTWGYVAPEWISGVAISAKADVYSYGMTLLELVSGRRNVETPPPPPPAAGGETVEAEEEGEEKWFFPPWAARQIGEGNVAAVVDPRLQGAYNVGEAERAALVAVWCIQDHEGARPTMGQVVKMLEGTVEVTVPPLPQLLQALVSGDSFRRVGIVSAVASRASTSLGCGDDDNHSDDKMSEISALSRWEFR